MTFSIRPFKCHQCSWRQEIIQLVRRKWPTWYTWINLAMTFFVSYPYLSQPSPLLFSTYRVQNTRKKYRAVKLQREDGFLSDGSPKLTRTQIELLDKIGFIWDPWGHHDDHSWLSYTVNADNNMASLVDWEERIEWWFCFAVIEMATTSHVPSTSAYVQN